MDKQAYASADSAPAAGPYSPVLTAGDLVFVSGQIALASDGSVVGATAADQTRKALENMKATLAAAGLQMDDVVKTTLFLQDMDDFAAVNEVYGRFFSEPYPARSGAQVSRLPKDVKVEIDAIAVR